MWILLAYSWSAATNLMVPKWLPLGFHSHGRLERKLYFIQSSIRSGGSFDIVQCNTHPINCKYTLTSELTDCPLD